MKVNRWASAHRLQPRAGPQGQGVRALPFPCSIHDCFLLQQPPDTEQRLSVSWDKSDLKTNKQKNPLTCVIHSLISWSWFLILAQDIQLLGDTWTGCGPKHIPSACPVLLVLQCSPNMLMASGKASLKSGRQTSHGILYATLSLVCRLLASVCNITTVKFIVTTGVTSPWQHARSAMAVCTY